MITRAVGTKPTKTVLQDCVKEWIEGSNNSPILTTGEKGLARLKKLKAYYDNLPEILNRKMTDGLPNNKVAFAFPTYISDTCSSYLAGNPVMYTGDKIEPLTDLYKKQSISTHDGEMALDCSIYGLAYELSYMSDDKVPVPKVAKLNPENSFVVFDNTVNHNSLFGVNILVSTTKDSTTYTINVDTDMKIITYVVTVNSNTSTIEDLYKDDAEWQKISEKKHYFERVPLTQFFNPGERADFEKVLTEIDSYNILQSDRINDIQQFVDSLLVLYGVVTGDDDKERYEFINGLKIDKVLELPDGAKAEWLTKSLNQAEIQILRDSLTDDIHKFSMTPNLSDKEFAGNSSGVALEYKLLAFENKTKQKERYYTKGLERRLKLYCTALNKKGNNLDPENIETQMSRALPVNDMETATMIRTLDGKVDDETLVGRLSFVKNVKEVIAKVKKQKEEDIKMTEKAFSQNGAVGDGDEQTTEENSKE